MPIPKSKDPSKIIRFLTEENKSRATGKKRSREQIAAIAYSQAKKSGAHISKRRKK